MSLEKLREAAFDVALVGATVAIAAVEVWEDMSPKAKATLGAAVFGTLGVGALALGAKTQSDATMIGGILSTAMAGVLTLRRAVVPGAQPDQNRRDKGDGIILRTTDFALGVVATGIVYALNSRLSSALGVGIGMIASTPLAVDSSSGTTGALKLLGGAVAGYLLVRGAERGIAVMQDIGASVSSMCTHNED